MAPRAGLHCVNNCNGLSRQTKLKARLRAKGYFRCCQTTRLLEHVPILGVDAVGSVGSPHDPRRASVRACLRLFFIQIADQRIQVIPGGVFSFGSPPELFDTHQSNAAETQPMSCGRRHINNSPANKWTTIIDPDNHRSTIVSVGYACPAPHRKRTMRGSECSRMRSLAIGSPSAAVGVHRRDATLPRIRTADR